jgi:hypothetical protein
MLRDQPNWLERLDEALTGWKGRRGTGVVFVSRLSRATRYIIGDHLVMLICVDGRVVDVLHPTGPRPTWLRLRPGTHRVTADLRTESGQSLHQSDLSVHLRADKWDRLLVVPESSK